MLTDALHCLTIDFTSAPGPLRAGFGFEPDEIRDLLGHAGSIGAPLLVLCTASSLTLVSTTCDHRRSFRPVLALLRNRLESSEDWRALPVRIASGSEVGRQLIRQALPLARFEPEMRAFVVALRAAAELSAACNAISRELSDLVRMTGHAAERVWSETGLGRVGSSVAELELEALAAERIAEEELVAWQSRYPALRASRRPLSESQPDIFGNEERHSMVQIRSTGVLSRLRSA